MEQIDQLMIDRSQFQIVLEIFEGRFDFRELNVEVP